MWVRAGALPLDRVQHPHHGPRQPGAHLRVLWGYTFKYHPWLHISLLNFLSLRKCLNLLTGGHERACCGRRCSSRTRGHRLPPLLVLLRQQQGLRSRHASDNGTKFQTDNRESQRWKRDPSPATVLCSARVLFHSAVLPFLVDYLVIRPIQGLQCDMSSCFVKHWKKRSTVDVGHRGAGSSHAAKWVRNKGSQAGSCVHI